MANVGVTRFLSRAFILSGAKVCVLFAIVVLTFLSVIAYGFSADGHNLYSADHRNWREAVSTLLEPTMGVGGLAMWLVAVFGGQRNDSAGYAIVRAALAALASILLMQIEPFSAPPIAFVVGGSLAAICFAGRHTWATLFVASVPYIACILTIFVYFTLAPPNTGPIGP